MQGGRGSLPLLTMLSQVFVAFTIEADNEFEHRMNHRTSLMPRNAGKGPWLTSMVMYWNCLRFLDEDGMTVSELQSRALTSTNLDGMRRWGYIRITSPSDGRPEKPARKNSVLFPTAAGLKARKTWEILLPEIEERWRSRFGRDPIEDLVSALASIQQTWQIAYPDCMPILGQGLVTRGRFQTRPRGSGQAVSRDVRLPVLLAQMLTAVANQFEASSEVSLSMAANILRVLDATAQPITELPVRSGVSREAWNMALSWLEKRDLVTTIGATTANSERKTARLTERGAEMRRMSNEQCREVEQSWRGTSGAASTDALHENLVCLTGPTGLLAGSPLAPCLEPYEDGWRSLKRPATALPHFPMILHRGGYPDGS